MSVLEAQSQQAYRISVLTPVNLEKSSHCCILLILSISRFVQVFPRPRQVVVGAAGEGDLEQL